MNNKKHKDKRYKERLKFYLIPSAYLKAKSLNFNNVPEKYIKLISKSLGYSFNYASYLNFQNVPKSIIKSLLNDINYSELLMEKIHFPHIKLLYLMFKYDKRLNL